MSHDGAAARERIRVFLLDAHEVARRGVRELLESSQGVVVAGEAGSAAEGVEDILALEPDVVLVDGNLPDASGVDVCRQICSARPGVAVVILTSYDDDETLLAAYLAGAAGCFAKQIRGNGLVETVRTVASGRSLFGERVQG
jgi:two-component system, NarL family, response regulator DevR